ncbi:hypothetical protein DPMN_180571 [Dreissena polymorpha]|uniref:Uncharacterized protein n=1 Tax=Dreissena polymorpha TaxID=45954 RepID=A0A9D4IND1_DREPO|nr:hypothetical protein DPMN_180571 [Dreissena polymorpha]
MKMERDLAKKKEEENEKNVEKKTDSDKDRNVEKQKDSNDNLFVTVYICADSLFGFGWCIVGMVWVFGNYSAMISECPGYVRDWNPAYITFAVVLTGVDLAVFLVFIIYVLCMEGCGDKK